MSCTEFETDRATRSPAPFTRSLRLGRGLALAGAVVAAGLTALSPAAEAGNGNGAAIGLGILGGVIAGAAIAAATAPPAYAAPPAYYYYPQGEYYYRPPSYYYAPQPYYGAATYGYPPYSYR